MHAYMFVSIYVCMHVWCHEKDFVGRPFILAVITVIRFILDQNKFQNIFFIGETY